jgi:hypothetical protein
VEDMKVIGLMGNTMAMEWKLGLEGVGIEGNIGKDLDMDLGCIGFIQEMFMPVNGLMDKVMVVEFILVRTGVGMLVNSSGVSSTDSGITISGKFDEFCYLEFILFLCC